MQGTYYFITQCFSVSLTDVIYVSYEDWY